MRVDDVIPPVVAVHPRPPYAPTARWPGRLVVAVERLPQAAYTWDDVDDTVVWDDPDPDRFVWDAPFVGSGFTDVFCDFQALTIESGEPDDVGLYPPATLEMGLANPDGRYSDRGPDGRLVFWSPGRPIAVWWEDPDGRPWWLFSGRITHWDQTVTGDIAVEAVSGLAELAQDAGRHWTPGTAGQYPQQRLGAICDLWGYRGPTRFALGTNPLAAVATEDPPLDVMQQTALSDGGILFDDADGAIVYVERGWRAGRDDQVDVPVWTSNVCVDGVAAGWDVELGGDDTGLATSVVLENTAGLVATAAVSTADPDTWYGDATYRYTHPSTDLWQTQADGDELARHLLAHRARPGLSLERFSLYLTDPRADLWAGAIDRRLGDRVRFLHEQVDAAGTDTVVDVDVVLGAIRHEIDPGRWVATYRTTRAVDYRRAELWDDTAFTWDDPNPANVYAY